MASLNEILAAVGFVTKKVEALTPAAPDASTLAEVATLKASIATITGERDALANEVATLKGENTKISTDLATALADKSTAEAKVKELEPKVESAERKAAEIVAGFGVPPAADIKGEEKPTLKGLARAVAAFKAQSGK